MKIIFAISLAKYFLEQIQQFFDGNWIENAKRFAIGRRDKLRINEYFWGQQIWVHW